MQLANSVGSSIGSQVLSKLLAETETVLKSVLGNQPGRLSKLQKGDNAVTFEILGLPSKFRPAHGSVICEVASSEGTCARDASAFYVMEVKGRLLHVAAFTKETGDATYAVGAVYTGPDKDGALKTIMQCARRFKH